MTTYKEIQGSTVQNYSGDPANPIKGQVWYDSSTESLKYSSVVASSSWSTGGNLNTGREQLGGAGATKDAALAFGGGPPPAPTAKAQTESYNGTVWTEVNDFNSAKAYVAGAGEYTSAIASGGDQYSGVTESWNGTSWTSVANSPNTGNGQAGAGADNTNALFFGGGPHGGNAKTTYWNGSSWTALNDFNTARAAMAGAGRTYTAALGISGGTAGSDFNVSVESFNGSSWTEIANVNTGRQSGSGAGTQTSALFFAGRNPSPVALAESWNGTAWTETLDLSTARNGGGNAGASNANALLAGGSPNSVATEEWTGAGPVIRTVPQS